MRLVWVLIVVGCLLGGVAFWVRGEVLVYLPFVALPVSVVGLGSALWRVYRSRTAGDAMRISKWGITIAMCAAAGVLVGHTWLAREVWLATSQYAKIAVTRANLKGDGAAIAAYCADQSDYPVSLQQLVEAGLSWKQLVTPTDSRRALAQTREATQSWSFQYCAGSGSWRNEPDVMLAWERHADSPLELRLLSPSGRCCLFGDSQVRVLGQHDFDAAIERDRWRRAELGWPTCD